MACLKCNALRAKVAMNEKLIADLEGSADNQKRLNAYKVELRKAKEELEAHLRTPHS
jgi:hypothetical protein